MSLNKPQPTEVDHIRDTLTDMVATVGETRQDLKQLDKKVEKGFTEVRADIARLQADNTELKTDVTELKADNAEIKEMLKTLLSR